MHGKTHCLHQRDSAGAPRSDCDSLRHSRPLHHEEKRAEFCRDWLIRNGADPARVRIDPALNTVYEIPGETDEVVIFMAHTDTVFPDMEPLPYHEEGSRMCCPGVGDDTLYVYLLLMAGPVCDP